MNEKSRDMRIEDDDITEEVTPSPEAERPRVDAVPSAPNSGDDAGYATHKRRGLDNAARSVSGDGGNTTMFQPGVMIDDILTEPGHSEPGLSEPGLSEPGATSGEDSGTQIVTGEPRPPKLTLQRAPYFLIVGAAPGEEKLPILHARTTFGRDKGDVKLNDRTISSRHFQLDVVGREFFIRDLGSRNGTQLNGYPVRYNEILPGDEVRAGETVLVFRTAGDGLAERRPGGSRSAT